MTTRAQLANHALSQNGVLDSCGYPGPGNPYDQFLGRPNEYWCGDFVTWAFDTAGIPLPVMQQGMPGKQTGFAFCPSALNYGQAHGLVIPSWQAQAGDIVLFDWNADGKADHTALVTAYANGGVYTVGGDSGPSNVDGYRGRGGVHRNYWPSVAPSGNWYILAVLNAARLVSFASTAPAPTSSSTPSWYHRQLQVTNPLMPQGTDVEIVQGKVGAVRDGWYGNGTAGDVKLFQEHHGLTPDGVVGPATAKVLGN